MVRFNVGCRVEETHEFVDAEGADMRRSGLCQQPSLSDWVNYDATAKISWLGLVGITAIASMPYDNLE